LSRSRKLWVEDDRVMTTSDELVTRDKILQAARPIVERFTVGKFSMEDVARAAGIARQTIYKHFSGRDDLLIAMYVVQLHEMSAKLAPLVELSPTEEHLIQLFCEELKLAQDFPLFDAMLDPAVAPKMAELVFSSDDMFQDEGVWCGAHPSRR
jgi:AcrR family transcriptional regulator